MLRFQALYSQGTWFRGVWILEGLGMLLRRAAPLVVHAGPAQMNTARDSEGFELQHLHQGAAFGPQFCLIRQVLACDRLLR